MELTTPIRYLKGIGEARSGCFMRLGIENALQLLEYYPRAYEDRSEIKLIADAMDGDICSIIATVTSAPMENYARSGITYIKVYAEDSSGDVQLTFFNQPYLKNVLTAGRKFRFYGRMVIGMFIREMTAPVAEAVYDGKTLQGIVPVYPLTKGLTARTVSETVKKNSALFSQIKNVLPWEITEKYGLLNKQKAMYEMHFPSSMAALAAAKKSLSFEELLVFQCALRRLKSGFHKQSAYEMSYAGTGISRFFASLPFSLTGAQERAVKDILTDLCKPIPMTRMVIGDVGSGKTVVAAAAIFFTVMQSGEKLQAAMMAPTEILAAQHYQTLTHFFSEYGIKTALLTGSVPKKKKAQLLSEIEAGDIDVIIGTHALISENVAYKNLKLVITDEQHRFGVMQRARLADKSNVHESVPHTLVMSATPIPRTLSLILYGDMDVTIIDELPPGRQKIDTFYVDESYRERIYAFIRKIISKGNQGYIICPLVEENENLPRKAVEAYANTLTSEVFPQIRTGILHGRMSAKKKDEIMSAFKSGEISLLISTTVIEVGVDVPNATIMLIENAECYGLSQLHQLRGRIGRGTVKSYCILMSDNKSEKTRQRLNVIAKTDNGFEIANEDLQLRGPGDFFGERQSGEILFKTASLADMALIEETKSLSDTIFDKGLLDTDEYKTLDAAVDCFFARLKSSNMVN